MKLSEQDTRSKHIDPAILKSGWQESQIRREVFFTDGQIIVRGKTVSRGERKRADYILYYKSNIPIAIVEAKDESHTISDGIQQALDYARILNIPFAFSSNGKGFFEHDRLNTLGTPEREISLDDFPSPEELFRRYAQIKDFNEEQKAVVTQDYFDSGLSRPARYYQQNAINKTVEAIVKGKNRLLLVMATGTGKTYTAFQIIYRLWKSRAKKKILFLVDRTALAQQTMQGDFRHFGDVMTKIEGKNVDPAYEIYIALYQGLTNSSVEEELFKQFSPNFFDLIIIDECHRGSSNENGRWRKVLEYYSSATQIGLTATPKETNDISTEEYFGEPIYTYSLKQGIEDGYLAPYKVIRYRFNNDEFRPTEQTRDEDGNFVEDRIYNESDFDRNIIIDARTQAVADRIAEFLRDTDPFQKTIVFCVDTPHAERMRQALVKSLPEYVSKNHKYVMRITGNDEIGKLEIENFTNPEETYPVIATTSQLLRTGVDTKTAKLIVLDTQINSMTEFKQIIGRGTRVAEAYNKYYFTIMDFRGVTRLFADEDFDGPPITLYEKEEGEPLNIKEHLQNETVSESEILKSNPHEDILIDGTATEEKPKKIRIREGVEFYPIQKTVQYIDPVTGKLITESLQDFSKKTILNDYKSLDEFLIRWKEVERKDIIISEFAEKGIIFDELRDEIGKDLDVFDLIMHIAYGKKPLTRSERVKNARSHDYFAKYEGKAREIIDLLLTKYADQGITAIDDIGGLTVSPFTEFGTPMQIVENIFGGKEAYLEIIKNIEHALYSE